MVYYLRTNKHADVCPFCSQTRLILPQWGHLILALLSLGGIFSLVPQAQVIVLYLFKCHIRSETSRVRSTLPNSVSRRSASGAAGRTLMAPVPAIAEAGYPVKAEESGLFIVYHRPMKPGENPCVEILGPFHRRIIEFLSRRHFEDK